jgi:mRNA-degrading endonuclease RelE of RelBE toxin-antitoxin system
VIIQTSKHFWNDISKIKDIEVLDEIEAALDIAKFCKSVNDIPGFKRLAHYSGYGRITIAAYRIGVKYSKKNIVFYRILHRSIIYKLFP